METNARKTARLAATKPIKDVSKPLETALRARLDLDSPSARLVFMESKLQSVVPLPYSSQRASACLDARTVKKPVPQNKHARFVRTVSMETPVPPNAKISSVLPIVSSF